jgi:hypothetical protein
MKLECECENLTEKEQYVLMALKHFKVIKWKRKPANGILPVCRFSFA